MAQDPAFLCYYKDILVSTADWDADELGWYMRLLCHQADKPEGLIADDMEALAALAGVKFSLYQKFLSSWKARMSKKFEVNEQGLLVNLKQASTLEDRRKFKEVSAEKGLFGYYVKMAKADILAINLAWDTLELAIKKYLRETISSDHTKEVNQANWKQTLEKIKANPSSWAISIIGDANGIGNANTNTGIGGAGGKGFGTEQNPVLWESNKKSFFNAGDWIFKFCIAKEIGVERFDELAKDFIADLEHKEDFKTSLKEIRSHFTSWFNKYHKNGTKQRTNGQKSTTIAARSEDALASLIARGNEKFNAAGKNTT